MRLRSGVARPVLGKGNPPIFSGNVDTLALHCEVFKVTETNILIPRGVCLPFMVQRLIKTIARLVNTLLKTSYVIHLKKEYSVGEVSVNTVL